MPGEILIAGVTFVGSIGVSWGVVKASMLEHDKSIEKLWSGLKSFEEKITILNNAESACRLHVEGKISEIKSQGMVIDVQFKEILRRLESIEKMLERRHAKDN